MPKRAHSHLRLGSNFARSVLSGLLNPFGLPGYFLPSYDYLTKSQWAKENTAVHEAGHALVCELLDTNSILERVSVKGSFSLHTISWLPIERLEGHCKVFNYDNCESAQTYNRLVVSMAGAAAEKIYRGSDHKPSGAGGDIAQAKILIRKINPDASEENIGLMLAEAEQCARDLLLANKNKLDHLTSELLEHHTLERSEVLELIR